MATTLRRGYPDGMYDTTPFRTAVRTRVQPARTPGPPSFATIGRDDAIRVYDDAGTQLHCVTEVKLSTLDIEKVFGVTEVIRLREEPAWEAGPRAAAR